jgi:outer membrane protein TolC
MLPLLLLLIHSASAADALTRDSAVKEALGTSPAIARAEAATDETDWRRAEIIGHLVPTLEATGSRYFVKNLEYNDLNFGGSPAHIPLIYPSTRASLIANWNLYNGFQDVHDLKAISRLKEAAHSDLDWTRFQLEEDVLAKFNDAIAALKLQAVAEQNVATLKDHLDQVTRTRKGGLATQYDVLRVEVQMNEAQSELLRAKDDAILAREKLVQTIGLDPTKDAREIAGELEIPVPNGVENLRAENADRKDLVALGLRAEASDHHSSAVGTYWIPKLSLGAQYTLYNNLTDGVTDWSQYRAAWNAGLFMTWTLFDLSEIAKSKEAGAQAVQAAKTAELARIQSPTDLEFWKRRFLYSAALYDAKVSDVKKSEESVRLAKAAMKAGVRTNSEVLDAELDLFRARAGLVNSLKNSAEARIKLELAIGHKLPGLAKNAT